MKKKIVIILTCIFLGTIGYGLYEFYRPVKSVKGEKADISMSSKELKKQLENDARALQKLGSSVIVVEGRISSLEKATTTTVLLDSSVKCELDQNAKLPGKDERVRIKGILGGYDDLFGEVLLVKCEVEELEIPEE